jgi:G3E family GTPase
MRANFVPAVRHVLGWRGVRFSRTQADAWTARINGQAGVFGIRFTGLAPMAHGVHGEFALHYFPAPEEELVEGCSLAAAAAVQQADYLQRVREFPTHPEFSTLFRVGGLSLSVNLPPSTLVLSLETANRLRSVAQDGVRLPRGDQEVEIIPPGGRDQDFPAWEVALAFFEVLAASATFNLGEAPALLQDRRFAGSIGAYDAGGASRRIPDPDIWVRRLDLAYGADAAAVLEAPSDAQGGSTALRHDRWRAGDGSSPWAHRAWWTAHDLERLKGVDRKFLGVDERPALMVLTGFLGAGKTSFLQHFIEYQTQRHRFVAVIQNEIGATGLDSRLVEDHFTVVEMDEGCVCCTLAGNLQSAIAQILSRFRPDTIVLETTGLANPANLLDELDALEELVRFDSVTTVVDAAHFEDGLTASHVAAEQVRAADILLVNKIDLVPDGRLEALGETLRGLNPRAVMVTCRHGDVHPGLLFGVEPAAAETSPPHSAAKALIGASHRTHLHDRIASLKVRLPSPADRDRFLAAVQRLPAGVFRAKGVVAFADRRRPEIFQYVAGRYSLADIPPNDGESDFLIVIGRDLDPCALESLFSPIAG